MANFCSNCGTRLSKGDNFCSNCGTKIDKSDLNQNNNLSKSTLDIIEKENARKELKRVVGGKILFNKTFGNELYKNGLDVFTTGKAIRQQVEKEIDSGQIKSGGVEFRVNQLILEYKIKKETRMAKEKEEEKRKLKMIDDIFESEEIKSEIRRNKIHQTDIIAIKDSLRYKLINKRENMTGEEIKHFIKSSFEKMSKAGIANEKENSSKEIGRKMNSGGYCSLNCKHCYEEFLDGGGAIVGDFDSDGYVEYYCNLGHSISYGSFCEDYE